MPESFEVAVVGGGPAGVAAAVSAARSGARTVLLEGSDVLGGNAGNALVHTICGLYHAAEGEPRWANPGFPKELAERLLRAGAAAPAERAGRVYVLPTYPDRMRHQLLQLCEETSDLSVLLSAQVTRAERTGDGFELAVGGSPDRLLHAALAIDTSGDANLAAAVGAEVEGEPARTVQTPSFIVRVRGVDSSETAGFGRMKVAVAVAKAAVQNRLKEGAGSVLLRPGPVPGEAYITLNVPRPADGFDPLDEAAQTTLTADARSSVEALVEYLRRERAGFADCEVVEWPRRLGVRESRRVVGCERLEAEHILQGRPHDGAVALSTWPIEMWADHKGARFQYPEAASEIPLAALISRSNHRLGVAGRCLSGSHEALGALRVIGTALATGEAIGVAAALAADAGKELSEVDADVVRARIEAPQS